MNSKKQLQNEKGSLALEQVLFIGAVVAMSVGVFAFYGNVSDYLAQVDVSGLASGSSTSGSTGASN